MAIDAAQLSTPSPGAAADLQSLQTLLTRIKERYNPLQIWLFGSRARGDARPGSDWDLLMVVPDDLPDRECDALTIWRLQKGSGVHADIIACRATEFREDWNTVNTISHVVAREGRLVYER